MSRITIDNQTVYPDGEVKKLVRFGMKSLGIHSTYVLVNHTRQQYWRSKTKLYCANPYSGTAFPEIPERFHGLTNGATVAARLSVARPELFPASRAFWRWGWEESHHGDWPLFKPKNWREALIIIAAHEAKHLEYFLDNLYNGPGELACELHAANILHQYKHR